MILRARTPQFASKRPIVSHCSQTTLIWQGPRTADTSSLSHGIEAVDSLTTNRGSLISEAPRLCRSGLAGVARARGGVVVGRSSPTTEAVDFGVSARRRRDLLTFAGHILEQIWFQSGGSTWHACGRWSWCLNRGRGTRKPQWRRFRGK